LIGVPARREKVEPWFDFMVVRRVGGGSEGYTEFQFEVGVNGIPAVYLPHRIVGLSTMP